VHLSCGGRCVLGAGRVGPRGSEGERGAPGGRGLRSVAEAERGHAPLGSAGCPCAPVRAQSPGRHPYAPAAPHLGAGEAAGNRVGLLQVSIPACHVLPSDPGESWPSLRGDFLGHSRMRKARIPFRSLVKSRRVNKVLRV
jgi:hypothetical protein